jgi:ketosteroid isomerase-like protein
MTGPGLQRLQDDHAIRALTAFYSDAVTHLDAPRAASVYAEDGRASITGHEIVGRTAIEEGMRHSFAEFSLLQLVEHGGVIEPDGDRARARWSTIELTVRRGSSDLNVVFGRYEDELVRTPGGWLFGSRTFSLAGRARMETAKLQVDPLFASTIASLLALRGG